MNIDILRVVSYHLRDFGQYQKLDLMASKMGNLTLLGANAVGKTTLANSWFPMLIDGAIASPSFNPARNSDLVTRTGNPRNTMRDKRTFESMFLGWGSSAFKVRTGYSYTVLKSASRTVVLGIGAHRQSDGMKSATWWFVLEPSRDEELVCVDADGHGLDLQRFRDVNANFGKELTVFKHWEDYRTYVAVNVYGFDSGEVLGKLANAYRLLASPILTSGGARFAPIPEALRDAQEPIDREQIIRPLAESQRQLNQTLAVQKQLEQGLKRLAKIQKDLFWGNLNNLGQGMLPEHIQQLKKKERAQTAADTAVTKIKQLDEELARLNAAVVDAQAKLTTLQERVAEQKVISQTRDSFRREIRMLTDKLTTFKFQQLDLTGQKEQLTKMKTEFEKLVQLAASLQKNQFNPLIAQLHGLSAGKPELTATLTQIEVSETLPALQRYVQTKQAQLQIYQNLIKSISHTSEDVQLVQVMSSKMDTAIDEHVNRVLAKNSNQSLHQANRQVHGDGMTTMNSRVARFQNQQRELLDQAEDLVTLLDNPNELKQIGDLTAAAEVIWRQLINNEQQQSVIEGKIKTAQEAIQRLMRAIDPNFNPDSAEQQIQTLTKKRDALQLDQTLPQQVQVQQDKLDKLRQSVTDAINKRGQQSGIAQTEQQSAYEAKQLLQKVDTELQSALEVLRPLAPDGVELSGITELLDFTHSNGAKIKQNEFSELGGRIRDTINGGDLKQALDQLFSERGASDIANALQTNRTVTVDSVLTVAFDLPEAVEYLNSDLSGVNRAVSERTSGQSLALETYITAAVLSINQQYGVIPEYNAMLTDGTDPDGIRLHVYLHALKGITEDAVAEARNLQASKRPALTKLVQDRINQLVADSDLAPDDEAFIDEANELLDTRKWSSFTITINRRHSEEEEEVNDAFVQSGGSGAEKAQAMVLPLLLVPKMRLRQASKPDAPHLVMFDEFADKLDSETAKAFAQTIDRFGFNFIATMPSGSQSKIMADKVANRAYEVLAPDRHDGKFHANQVHEILSWREALADE